MCTAGGNDQRIGITPGGVTRGLQSCREMRALSIWGDLKSKNLLLAEGSSLEANGPEELTDCGRPKRRWGQIAVRWKHGSLPPQESAWSAN